MIRLVDFFCKIVDYCAGLKSTCDGFMSYHSDRLLAGHAVKERDCMFWALKADAYGLKRLWQDCKNYMYKHPQVKAAQPIET